MNTLMTTLKYFLTLTVELLVLFMLISAVVELILIYVPEEKIQKRLSGKGIIGNAVGAIFGALTPFCSCSTIPVTLGLLNAKVPFGSTMSFLIASPLLNPIIIGMLGALIGLKAAIIYFALTFILSIIFGYILGKIGGAKLVKNVRLKGNNTEENIVDRRALPFKEKLKIAFAGAWGSLRPVLGFLFIGVAIGAAIYGYMPQDFVAKIAGPDNLFAVPIAAIVGIPLYIRAETAIPIGVALMGKGMGAGTVVALIIGGAGMSIPEMSMIAGIFKPKLVAAIVMVIFLTAVISGFAFNMFY